MVISGCINRMFAFWRLIAQGVTSVGPSAHKPPAGQASTGRPLKAHDPEVRIIRLTSQVPRKDEAGEKKRVYHHRWPVQMHKIRQRYPVGRSTV
jgi:hypothetical protein